MISYVFNKFERSKWESLSNLTEIESCKRLLWNIANFQTPQIWLGPKATPCHNLKALPPAFPYIFSEICPVLGYFQRFTKGYHQFFKTCIYINLL